MDMDLDLVTKDCCGGERGGAEGFLVPLASSDRDSQEELGLRLGLGRSTPEPNERKREWGEEESRRLEERRQKLKSEERLESGVESAESNCDCFVVSTNGGATERRSDADHGSAMRLSFVPNHRYKPNVRFLGTSKDSLPLGSEGHDPDWESHLVTPADYMTLTPSSPALPLFSLIRLPAPHVVVDGLLEIGRNEFFGISYSLPINPPHSLLIPSLEHPLPTFPTTAIQVEAIIGSCNGLYCLQSALPVKHDWIHPCDKVFYVIVWNPTTGLSRQLPPCRYPPHSFDVYDGLIFGFGYDKNSDDYKVVKIDADTRLVEVFSLYSNSNSWRSVQGLPQDICNVQRHFSDGAVSFKGCLNWLVYSGHSGQNMVASFNLTTESFRFLPLHTTTKNLYGFSLCVLDARLLFVSLHDLSRDSGVSWTLSTVLDVWIMRDYDNVSSWTNAASIVFPHFVSFPYRILYLSKDVLILAIKGSRPYVFNLKENSLTCPHIYGAAYNYCGFEPYVESKVSPNRRCNFTDQTLEITPNCLPQEESNVKEDTKNGVKLNKNM